MKTANELLYLIEGDWRLQLTEFGISRDADSMIEGRLSAWKSGHQDPIRNVGLLWDSYRILVDTSEPLHAREVEALIEAGFIVDEAFMP